MTSTETGTASTRLDSSCPAARTGIDVQPEPQTKDPHSRERGQQSAQVIAHHLMSSFINRWTHPYRVVRADDVRPKHK
jgi:hypothetical protein